MRIALFGAGLMGRSLARKLLDYDFVDELIVADKDNKALDYIRFTVNNEKLSLENMDVSNVESLSRILSRVDLAIAAIPPSLAAINIVKICMDTGCNYLDLGLGDYPLLEILKNEDLFRNSGMSVFPCYGSAPGITNIIAKHLAHKLDIVDEIRIRDGSMVYSKRDELIFTYSPSVFLADVSVKPRIYENKTFKRKQPLSLEEDYEFPPPVGKLKVYLIRHEETLTLPRYLGKDIKYLDFKLALARETYQTIKVILKLGLLRDDPIEVDGVMVSPKSVLLSLLPKPVNFSNIEGHEMLLVEVKGIKDGKRIKSIGYVYLSHKEAYQKYNETATAYLTTLLPLIIIEMLHKGEINQTGLILPEMLDCETLLQKLIQKGMPYNEKDEQI
jgi:saccharopine dehydrogenase (NAD+, L-lysine-forming)